MPSCDYDRNITILSKTIKITKMPDIAGFSKEMREMGADVSIKDDGTIVIKLGGKK